MRIALVEFSPSGGLFQFAVQLGEGLARRGHSVRLLTGPEPELGSREPGFEVLGVLPTWHPQARDTVRSAVARRVRRAWRAGRLTVAWLRLAVLLRRMRPDAVLFSTWRFPLDAWGVRLVRRVVPDARLGIVAHEPRPLAEQSADDGAYKRSPLLTRALEKAWACMDVAFTLGERARDIAVETWSPRAPVTVIPHGDESVFVRGAFAPVASTRPQVLFFGTLTHYKGVDVLLDAFEAVRGALPDATLVLAGAIGNDVDATALERRVEALDGVELHPGYVPLSEVPAFFERARVVALPYTRASQSGVAHLAQTFARPVVASRVGDIPGVVTDGVDGWLVEPGDPDALADALLVPLRDVATAAARGQAGAERISGDASWDVVARKVSEALEAARQRPRASS